MTPTKVLSMPPPEVEGAAARPSEPVAALESTIDGDNGRGFFFFFFLGFDPHSREERQMPSQNSQ